MILPDINTLVYGVLSMKLGSGFLWGFTVVVGASLVLVVVGLSKSREAPGGVARRAGGGKAGRG